jgi:hypothetical protein
MDAAGKWGLVVGLVLGIVWMWLGFGPALLTGVLGLLGWLIGTLVGNWIEGDTRVAELWNDWQARRRTGP